MVLSKLHSGISRRRAYQLFRTALTILRRDGLGAFVYRVRRWLKGERRYWSRGFTGSYAEYCAKLDATPDDLRKQQAEAKDWSYPRFSIITAVYNPPPEVFQAALNSVLSQSYPHWEWCIANASTHPAIGDYLSLIGQGEPRLKVITLPENQGISANTNAAFAIASGDYLVMFDHDDTLALDALYQVAAFIRAHPDADFIYSDADKLDENGIRCEPFFKPDFSPELMLSANFMCQLSVFRRAWLEKIGLLDPAMDGAQDWDYYLKITEHTAQIYHIPKFLYHWRKIGGSTAQADANKPYLRAAQTAALANHLKRTGIADPQVFFDADHQLYRVFPKITWHLDPPPSVAIVVPSKNQLILLGKFLETLFKHTEYPNFRLILVDTGSTDAHTWALYDHYRATEPRFALTHYTEPFNFSRACNLGASFAKDADALLFMNNDMEVIHPDWLWRMVQWLARPKIGVVGAKLLYPDGAIQHMGVIVGLGGIASHHYTGHHEYLSTHFGSDVWYRNYLAVTGACLLIRRSVYDAVGGFDEGFDLNFSDVDLCLKVAEVGYRVLYTPDARLIHYESATHKRRVPRKDFLRAAERWSRWHTGDPYYNPHLSYGAPLPHYTLNPNESAAAVHANIIRFLPKKDLLILPDDLA
ncbi:MAG: glycosyltransferase family 2 protein [Anaerolineae bacterium]